MRNAGASPAGRAAAQVSQVAARAAKATAQRRWSASVGGTGRGMAASALRLASRRFCGGGLALQAGEHFIGRAAAGGIVWATGHTGRVLAGRRQAQVALGG